MMVLGIDGSNLRSGGALAHIAETLLMVDAHRHGFERVVLWGERALLERVADRPWLDKVHEPLLDGGLLRRWWWQLTKSAQRAAGRRCDVLFVPSGIVPGDFRPFVALNQNLLPFEWREIRRYGASWQTLRNLLLRWLMSSAFTRADGLIFLSQYARARVGAAISVREHSVVIPHGVHPRFDRAPRPQRPIEEYSAAEPFRILYVSTVDLYKHQDAVVAAAGILRGEGLPIAVDLVGGAYRRALARLLAVLRRVDPGGVYVRYHGPAPHESLAARYASADLFLFASSCETFGQILTEAMAAGLPIVCSDRSSMPELLGDAALYFDPEDPADIARAVRQATGSAAARAALADAAYRRARDYSWQRCADETFRYLSSVAQAYPRRP
jgi:glycosyltransferase involved in cell wall biosynthesis